jgi:hypothetical protein
MNVKAVCLKKAEMVSHQPYAAGHTGGYTVGVQQFFVFILCFTVAG